MLSLVCEPKIKPCLLIQTLISITSRSVWKIDQEPLEQIWVTEKIKDVSSSIPDGLRPGEPEPGCWPDCKPGPFAVSKLLQLVTWSFYNSRSLSLVCSLGTNLMPHHLARRLQVSYGFFSYNRDPSNELTPSCLEFCPSYSVDSSYLLFPAARLNSQRPWMVF